jgi:hypothetical protein
MSERLYPGSYSAETKVDSLRSEEKYRIILEINNAIISNLKFQDLFQAITEAIREKLSFDLMCLILYEPMRDVVRLHDFKAFYSSYFVVGFEVQG